MTMAAIATLVAGIVIGYFGQRSRMCFVGAIRDFVLFRDSALMKGLLAFLATALLAYPLLNVLGGDFSVGATDDSCVDAGGNGASESLLTLGGVSVMIIGGIGIGIFSTLANGCPFRQHVLAGRGVISAFGYLAGFYVAAVTFHWFVLPFLDTIF